MNRRIASFLLSAPVILGLLIDVRAHAQAAPSIEQDLKAARHADADRKLSDHLRASPQDDNARLALGVVRFLRAVQDRAQAFYRHGYNTDSQVLSLVPFTHLPIPKNAKPQPLTYRGLREMLQTWINDLERVEQTLAPIRSDQVKLRLSFGLVGLDLDGDGTVTDEETLWHVYKNFNQQADLANWQKTHFVIGFDRGDVEWLRGYCHLLSGLAEVCLAHDFSEFFDHVAFRWFSGAKPPWPFLDESRSDKERQFQAEITDLVAAIHLVRFPASEPARLKSALGHLESVVTLSRSSWKFILAETDDDAEWIPNPKQKAATSNVKVTREMIDGWHDFLDEFEAILAGKKLAPFWRGNDSTRGVNVRRVFTEPRTLDLVMWVQGSAAGPYLEQGDITRPQTWERLNRIFQGEFVGFAFWFN